ncbi:MAG: DNA polymerase, partial [Bacilli bacterium]|nr:DNA polymerase [Bacilli bacterium]
EQRRRAKAANFAIIYGTTPYGLSDQIGAPVWEATQMIQNFYKSYPAVSSYLQSIISQVEHCGFVTTMFGRRRYLRDIVDPNYAKREAARRAALNAPVQGSAADIIKIAMLNVAKYLKEKGLKTKMVLQIHDELLFDVPEEEMEFVKDELANIMVSAVKLPVKLEVEGGYGRTWYEAKD